VALSTTVELGGATRQLRYDLNALAEIEERLGITMANLASLQVSAKAIRTLVWAGLLHEAPTLIEHDVGAWITGENIADVSERSMSALAESFGSPNGNPPAAAVPSPGLSPSAGPVPHSA